MPTVPFLLPVLTDSLNRADDFFREILGRKDRDPLTVSRVGDAVEIRVGSRTHTVPEGYLTLTPWDHCRLVELQNRIAAKISIYRTLSSAASFSPGEQALLEAQLVGRRAGLSRDFRELLRLVDRALGSRLVDRALGSRVSDHFRSRYRERTGEGATEQRMARR